MKDRVAMFYFQLKGYELKNRLMTLAVDLVGLSYTELMLIRNSDVDCAGICVKIILLIVSLSESFFWFYWR